MAINRKTRTALISTSVAQPWAAGLAGSLLVSRSQAGRCEQANDGFHHLAPFAKAKNPS